MWGLREYISSERFHRLQPQFSWATPPRLPPGPAGAGRCSSGAGWTRFALEANPLLPGTQTLRCLCYEQGAGSQLHKAPPPVPVHHLKIHEGSTCLGCHPAPGFKPPSLKILTARFSGFGQTLVSSLCSTTRDEPPELPLAGAGCPACLPQCLGRQTDLNPK